jgi:hypothetical protein
MYYEIGICNLHPNSILLVSTFIHLCKAFGGFAPHYNLFLLSILSMEEGVEGGILVHCQSVPNTPRWNEVGVPQLPLEDLPW